MENILEGKEILLTKTGDFDDWSRPIYKDQKGRIFVDNEMNDENPDIHVITTEGEPLYRLKNYKVVDKFANGGSVDYKNNLHKVDVIFENKEHNYSTNVSGKITEKEARDYFVGNHFNVGSFPKEQIETVMDIKFYPKGTYANGGQLDKDLADAPTWLLENKLNTIRLEKESGNFDDNTNNVAMAIMSEINKRQGEELSPKKLANGGLIEGELSEAKAKLAAVEKKQQLMKDVNAIIRSKKDIDSKLKALGLSDDTVYKVQQPDYAGRIGFATYQLTNNNAKMKRLQERVKMLEGKMQGFKDSVNLEEEKYVFDGGEIEVNYPIDRVQILFPNGRTDKETYTTLRKNGWVYSPSNKAFQRKITPQAIRNVVQLFKATKSGTKKNIETTKNEEPELVWFTAEALEFVPKHQIPTIKGAKKEFQDAIIRVNKAVEDLPVTYKTDGVKDKMIYLHYFYGSSDWYIVEKDKSAKEDGHLQDFGYAKLIQGFGAELGYISIDEIVNEGRVELDLYFEPKLWSEINGKKEETPIKDDEHDFTEFDNITELPKELKHLKDKGFSVNEDDFISSSNKPKSDYEKERERQLAEGLVSKDEEGISILGMTKGKNNPVDKLRKEQNKETKLSVTAYSNPYELNRAIEAVVDKKGDDRSNYTSEEIEFIGYYSGYGGLEKFGASGKGLLYEYFTPTDICKKMWALAYKYGYGTIGDSSVLETSVGTGNFLKYAPENVVIDAYEINPYSQKICKVLYPHAEVILQPFEQNFIKNNLSIKSKVQDLPQYSLCISNPPYGKIGGLYMGMGEAKYTGASNYTEYFIFRGLDMLVSGGLLIFIVGAEQKNGGTLFLDSQNSKIKERIFEKADLLDAYRLPVNIFERTGVSSEILVFKKR